MTSVPGSRYPAARYHYLREYFDPVQDLVTLDRAEAISGGDRSGPSPYHYDEEVILAVNAALAAGRPLLVAGRAGTGKTALAANVAAQLRWHHAAEVVTGATVGQDLLWRYDAVRRLHDAYLVREAGTAADSGSGHDLAPDRYVERGVLWQAFDASRRGEGAVVLIDEIDKADPEVPDSLLEVLGNGQFTVRETGETVSADPGHPPLVVITTNDERELSRPFRRRCVTLTLPPPDADRLLLVAATWGLADGTDGEVAARLAREVQAIAEGGADGTGRAPSAAEYLDALRVCLKLRVDVGGPEWAAVRRVTLLKSLDPDVGG
ncbi:AAA family ATPase [Geodermatophilus normandii]|uniref:AAA family ATPase n=1 Tax=Geodermatophilus normandii TaxID=1137989 RepID=UPI0019533ABB|nr:MoxR family ATPase [Geodermatophilus normandii]